MSALQRSRTAFRRAMGLPQNANRPTTQSRGLASEDTPVSWAEYRSGQKTLAEWVDGNRAKVAFGMFVFYVSLAAWNLRPKKNKKAVEAQPADQPPAASS